MNVLECRNLSKRYGKNTALNNLSLALPEGKIIGLLGPNGSGKTTLIKITAGLLTADMGEVLICGQKIGKETKAMVSYLSERSYLEKWMKVTECLDYFEDFYEDFDRICAEDMLMKLGIDPEARLKTLSKGTLEKVHLILVMSRRARLYLLDEPIGGVDPAARDYILQTILTNYNEKSTILISTHLINDVERVLDEFVFIKNGKVVRQDTSDNVRNATGGTIEDLFKEEFRC